MKIKQFIAWILCAVMLFALVPASLAEDEPDAPAAEVAEEGGRTGVFEVYEEAPEEEPVEEEPAEEPAEEPVEEEPVEEEPAEEPVEEEPAEEPDRTVVFEEPEKVAEKPQMFLDDPEEQAFTEAEGPQREPELRTTASKAVTSYHYEVEPILAPFPYFIYVKTDNPDPMSFRLVDKKSRYYGSGDKGQIADWTSKNSYTSIQCDPGTYYLSSKVFNDVVYEGKDLKRVPGGYIFETRKAYPDGGELVLQEVTKTGSSIFSYQYADTSVKISCPSLKTSIDYLTDTYTDASKTLFENLTALQAGMEEICVYPQGLYDSDRPNERSPYPYLFSSYYQEHPLMSGCTPYMKHSEWLLASEAYPFILDSLSFPSVIWSVAERLDPNAEIKWNGYYHWLIDVTVNGETKSFGGAGEGEGDELQSKRVEKRFRFNGASNDLSRNGTIPKFRELLMHYQDVATEDLQYWYDMVEGDTYRQTIRKTGGTWIRLLSDADAYEYAYVVPLGNGVWTASNTWVDGKYIGKYERIEYNQTFEDHPTADIILHDVSYVDHDGNPHCQDVVYRYDRDTDTWRAGYFYSNAFWYSYGWTIPDELILTREEAEAAIRAMDIKGEGRRFPRKGLIYDGLTYPGTPFENTLATGVKIPATYEAILGVHNDFIPVTMVPSNACCPYIMWESSDSDVVTCEYSNLSHKSMLNAKKEGTATLTATTLDGWHTATCVVTVVPDVTFKEQPKSKTVRDGDTVTFRVRVSARTGSADQITYQWQHIDGDRCYNLGFTGYNTNTMTVQAAEYQNGWHIRCRISVNGSVKAYSREAILKVKPLEIGSVEFNPEDVQFKGTTPYVTYTGDWQKPRVIVKDKDGKEIGEKQYTLAYRDNWRPGTAFADVTCNGKTISAKFKIYLPATKTTTVQNRKDGIRITWSQVPGATGYVIYRRAWNAQSSGWTTFERWNNTTNTSWIDKKVYAGTRYQYGIKAYYNDPMDNYNLGIVGPLKTTVRITTRSIRELVAGKGKLTVKWDGSEVFTGYQLQISTDANFRENVKAFKITDRTICQKTVKSLVSGQTYYVRIRSYQVFEGMTYFGGWSAIKNCKVK